MPADKEEFEAALREGAIYRELLQPFEFEGEFLRCQKMQLGEPGSDGRRQVIAIKDQYETFEIDSLISAIGENVDTAFLARTRSRRIRTIV